MKFIFTIFIGFCFLTEAIVDSFKEISRPKNFKEALATLALLSLAWVLCTLLTAIAVALVAGYFKALLLQKKPIIRVTAYDDKVRKVSEHLMKYYPSSSKFDFTYEDEGHVYITATNPLTHKKSVVVAMTDKAIGGFFYDIVAEDAVAEKLECYLYEPGFPAWECLVTFSDEVMLRYASYEGYVPANFRPKVLKIARELMK